ncbi:MULTISPECIES: DUF3862 domain-containing protein [Clostridium]|uniref:DUF3862 domain-containing protein n=1 Tax=Clostridium sporogenes TaxID=1509 RepID=A0A7X5P9F2_CLOSG|nr:MULTISPECIES: DUF3862 domain-containing protein [Clostridium]AJD30420.1 beta-lactamase inhibitor family protein [Clostridium botulinum Prevot_594]AVP60455.1 DUF3862 domain-containing protein [Clostridium botulinum]AKC63046.1 hypothetical protein DUF3862 [Clostridium sporogenes]AKJ90272.1 hypothetical protein CLSPOx_11705 [Clostridium sporogenes]KCZ67733.1 hypothetical protein DUF3862 [Clostridium sporogenes]
MLEKKEEPFYKKIWFWIIAIVIVCGVASYGGNKKINITDTKNSAKTEVKKDDTRKVTYEKFCKIKIGSTYEEVKSILGEYKESKETKIDGIKVIIYTWYNDDNSKMDVIVKNNKVIGKAQAGLSVENAEVNLIKYTKIQKGMDYGKVKDILGNGELMYISEINGSTKLIYLWANPNGSNMNITFENGKVTSKNRLGLN